MNTLLQLAARNSSIWVADLLSDRDAGVFGQLLVANVLETSHATGGAPGFWRGYWPTPLRRVSRESPMTLKRSFLATGPTRHARLTPMCQPRTWHEVR